MANKRTLKKDINFLVFDVIDECIYIQERDENKLDESEKLIEQAIDFYNKSLSDINKGKTKQDFRNVVAELNEKTDFFFNQLNVLNQ